MKGRIEYGRPNSYGVVASIPIDTDGEKFTQYVDRIKSEGGAYAEVEENGKVSWRFIPWHSIVEIREVRSLP